MLTEAGKYGKLYFAQSEKRVRQTLYQQSDQGTVNVIVKIVHYMKMWLLTLCLF